MFFLLRRVLLLGFFLSIYATSFTQHQTQYSLQYLGEVKYTELVSDYNYYGFDANNDFLIWYEGYTATLFVYEISEKQLNKITLKQGRGPNEYQSITGFFISDDNIIHLVDNGNAKFIRIQTSGEFLEDIKSSSGIMPSRIAGNDLFKVIKDIVNQNALFYLFEPDYNTYNPIEISKSLVSSGFLRDVYQKAGRFIIHGDHLVHLIRYYPYLYIYTLDSKTLISKIQFDESVVIRAEPVAIEGGGRMSFPPEKVDILGQDITRIPGASGRVWLLMDGRSKNRDYGLDRLFEFDFINEVFVGVHELGLKANSITVNDHYLFVFSEGDYKIHQYRINRIE